MTTNLTLAFANAKPYLPKARLSRWAEFRLNFATHAPTTNWPATRAIWEIKEWGETTRSRWNAEYRHQRRLTSITKGTDYRKPTDQNEP